MKCEPLWLILAMAPTLACSSFPVFPREDAGASLNLATETYVRNVEGEILQRELPRRLDTLLVDDRQRISLLQESETRQDEQFEGLSQEVSGLSETLDSLAQDVQRQAETFGAVAAELRQTSTRLDAAIAALPTETLRQFSRAIQLYLEERDAQEAQPGETPAEKKAPPAAADVTQNTPEAKPPES